jgi:hypothetical protein
MESRNEEMRIARKFRYVLFAAVAALLVWAISSGQTILSWNVATYIYMAKAILGGGLPYRDAFDVKGPGIYYFYATQMWLFGSAGGMKILDALWQACTALVLVRLGVRLYRREAAGWAAAVIYLIMQCYHECWSGFAEPDTLVALPVGLGVLAILHARDADRFSLWFLGGLTMGVAALLKLPAGLLGVAMIVVAARQTPVDWRKILLRLAGLAAGFATPLLLCILYFRSRGGLAGLYASQFVQAPEYLRAFSAWGHWMCIRESLLRPHVVPLYVLGGVALAGLVFVRRDSSPPGEGLVLAWLGVSVGGLLLHGLFFAYHFMPLLAPLAILSGEAITLARAPRKDFPEPRIAAWILLGFYLLLPVIKISRTIVANLGSPSGQAVPPEIWTGLAFSLRARTAPEDTLFIWGNLPSFYLQAERRSASRYFHSVYLSMPVGGAEVRKTFLSDLAASRPKFFVVNKAGPIGGNCPFGELDYYAAFENFSGLQRVLAEEYVVEEETSRYRVYRRNDIPQ